MDWTEIMIAVIGLIFMGVISPLVKIGFEWLKNKTQNENLKAAIEEAYVIADTTVAGLQADVVDGLKAKNEDGKLTADEAKEVMGMAVNKFMQNISDKTLATLEANKYEIVTFVSDLLEQRLAVSKK